MAANAGGAYVELVPRVSKDFGSQASSQLQGPLEGAAKSASSRLGSIVGGALAIGGGIALGAGLKNFFSGSISEAQEAAKVAAQTQAVLKSTGSAAGVSADAVSGLADKLSSVSGVDDEVIAQAENVLLTFTNVKNAVGAGNDVFNQATTAALDMSKALGTDLQGATIQIGKALNDPIKGITALQRVGVSFTQQQRDQIQALVDSGKTMEAQKLILGELQKEFGGTAAAVATPWEKLQVTFKNVEESVGGALQPAISALAPVLGQVAEALAPVLTALGSALAPVITALIPVVQALAPPLGMILTVLGQLLVPIAGLVAALAPVVGLFAQMAASVLAALLPALTPLITVLTQVVTMIGTALKPVVAEITTILQQNAQVFGSLLQALVPILPALGQLLIAVLPLLPVILELATLQLRLVAALTPVITKVLEFAAVLIDKVAGAVQVVVGFIRDELVPWFEKLPGRIAGAVDAIVGFFRDLPGKIGGFLEGVFEPLWTGFKRFVNMIIRGWNGLHFDIPEVDLGPIGKVGGGRIRVPQIPYLAQGGDVMAGGLAVVGDRGPELLNLPAGATVTPLENGAALGMGPYVVEVPVIIDGREIARATREFTPTELESYRRAHS